MENVKIIKWQLKHIPIIILTFLMYCYAQTKAAENGETFTNAIKPGNPNFL